MTFTEELGDDTIFFNFAVAAVLKYCCRYEFDTFLGLTIETYDYCAESPCSHYCVTRESNYICLCPSGYYLATDHECRALSSLPFTPVLTSGQPIQLLFNPGYCVEPAGNRLVSKNCDGSANQTMTILPAGDSFNENELIIRTNDGDCWGVNGKVNDLKRAKCGDKKPKRNQVFQFENGKLIHNYEKEKDGISVRKTKCVKVKENTLGLGSCDAAIFGRLEF